MCAFLRLQPSFLLLLLAGCGQAEQQPNGIHTSQIESSANDANQPSVAASRRIVYTANMSVEAANLDQFASQLRATLPTMNGFVANLNQYGASGQQEQASWTLRVSAENFFQMLAWIESNAVVITKTIDSQDVTEEYVDVESRIANKRKAEQRLLELLENRSAKLEDVLIVEKELDRVRESIERMEGRLRFLAERTSLSTIQLTVVARSNYQSMAQAGFRLRVKETWTNSIDNLTIFLVAAIMVFVSLAPWLTILLAINLIVLLCWRIHRSLRRKTATQQPIQS